MKPTATHVDSDSGRSPSDDEKRIGIVDERQPENLPPDPDEGLSDEERARIVRSYTCACMQPNSKYQTILPLGNITTQTDHHIGQAASVEARH